MLISAVFLLNFVSANSYYLEFDQIGSNLLVTEKLDNTIINNYTLSEGLTLGNNMHFLNKVNFKDLARNLPALTGR